MDENEIMQKIMDAARDMFLPKTLKDCVELARGFGDQALKDSGQCPAIMFMWSDNQMHVSPMDLYFDDPNSFKAVIGSYMKANNTQRYAVISEVWALAHKVEAGETPPSLEDMPLPSQHPDRVEVLAIVAAAKTGETEGGFWEIQRNEKGKIVKLQEWVQKDSGKPIYMDGPLSNLFGEAPEGRPVH